MQLLNTTMMKHPLNWVIIFFMLFLAGMAFHFILQGLGYHAPSGNAQPAGYGSAPQEAQ